MARSARFGGLGTPVATEAFGRVEASVNAVANQVISAMGHKTPGIRMIFDRRLQAGARTVAIAAETELVAHVADSLAAGCRQPVVVAEKRGVLVASEREAIGLLIMAIRAPA